MEPGLYVIGLGLFLLVGLVLVIVLTSSPGGSAAPLTADQQLGKTVYDANCAACHGIDGEGQPPGAVPAGGIPAPPHDETGHTWHHPDSALFNIVNNGGVTMPGFSGTLTEEEMEASLSYIKSFWTESQRQQQAAISNQ